MTYRRNVGADLVSARDRRLTPTGGHKVHPYTCSTAGQDPSRFRRGFLRIGSLAILPLLGLLAFTVLADDASIPGVASSPTIATVNGEKLSLADVERYLGRVHDSADAKQRSDFDLDRLIFRLVNDTLLGQEARALGLDREGQVPEQVEAYRDRLVTAALEREEIAERSRPTDKEVRAAFEEKYPEITLQVVTAYDRQGAEELLAELRAGADMEALARERSVDPYAGRGGRVESVAAIDLQREVAELAKSLAVDPVAQFGGPVHTDLGYSVIRVVEVRPADPERFPGVERTLRQLVRQRKSQALRAALATAIRERHAVEVDRELVASVRAERLPDARLTPRLADPGGVVARFVAGGEDSDPGKSAGELRITAEDFRKALLARWSGVRNAEAALAAVPIVLTKMLEQRLLLAEARSRGYGERPEVRLAARAFETSLLVPRYLEEMVAPEVEVSRQEMEAYYRDHLRQFTRPPRIRLGQITVAAEEEARRIAGLLRDGADLAWLARQHSIDRFKESGGDRGWVEPGSSGFDQRLLSAGIGDVLDPVGVRGNYVVLKVTARQERDPYSFDQVSGNVRSAVSSRKMRAAIEQLMDTLRARSEIEIDRELLASLRLGGSPSESEERPSGHGH